MLTIHKASAGSGKTFALAKDYIMLLLGIKNPEANEHDPHPYSLNLSTAGGAEPRLKINNRHRHILAITFTRKATEEMKTRIIDELRALSLVPAGADDPSKYAEPLCQAMRCSRSDIAAAAALALQQLLFDFKNFNVSTIDSFFQRVLRTFARELDYQGNFELELEDEEAMRTAVGSMLDQFNLSLPAEIEPKENIKNARRLENWIFKYMFEEISQGHKSNFFNRKSGAHTGIVKQLTTISNESFKEFADDMRQYLASGHLGDFEKALNRLYDSIPQLVRERHATIFQPQGPIDPSTLRLTGLKRLAAEKFPQGLPPDFGKDYPVSVENCLSGEKDDSIFARGHERPEWELPLREFFIWAKAQWKQRAALKDLRKSVTMLGLLQLAWDVLKQQGHDTNTLLLSDTNSLLSTIIGDDEAPFVYERMGVQLRNFLIDEFQDTSKMQWSNLRPLIINGLSETNDSLVIGDEKQSIYRWRNSDSSILHSGIETDKALTRHKINKKGANPGENTNYRSSADVVRFNNSLFSILAEQTRVTGFENVAQMVCDDNIDYKGHIRFCPMDKDETATLDAMAAEILRLTDPEQGRYCMKDIAILVNTNKEGRHIVEYLLSRHPDTIPVASDEALYLTNSAAVQQVMSMLRILDQEQLAAKPATDSHKPYPTRQEAFLALNRFQYYMGQTGRHEPLEPDQAVDYAIDPALDPDSANLLVGISAIKAQKPPTLVSLIETIIERQFTPQERTQHGAYLATLLDMAIEFCSVSDASLHSFIEHYDTVGQKQTIGTDASIDAVRVMTIHKSKGLEFDCVLIPLCGWNQHFKIAPQVWAPVSEAFAEELFPDIADPDKRRSLCPPALLVELSSAHGEEGAPMKAVYDTEWAKSLTDSMNKTYVAFTRAKAELLVWYKPLGKDKSGKTTKSDLFTHLLLQAFGQGLPIDTEGIDSIVTDLRTGFDGTVLQLGAPTQKSEKAIAKEAKKTALKGQTQLIAYASRPLDYLRRYIAIDYEPERAKTVEDGLEPATKDEPEQTEQARMEGLLMHDIMAGINHLDDLDRAVALTAANWHVTIEQLDPYRKIISEFLAIDDPRIESWFGDYEKAYLEQPIYVPRIDADRRPDRVVVRQGHADIIDYKFTDNPDHIGLAEHVKQVNEYGSLLRDMGFASTQGYLCYPRLKKIIKT